MKLYIQKTNVHGAWKWINEGYRKAWLNAGYDVQEYSDILEVNTSEEYSLMAWEYDIKNRDSAIDIISQAKKSFLYVQPNKFPAPWGNHPNWQCSVSDKHIEQINSFDNTVLWNFGDCKEEYFCDWKKVHSIPLAFDSISYQPTLNDKYAFDVCFVGGWADNGMNEKKNIMIKHFHEIKKLNLKCGFFINKGISVQQEANVLFNSKIAINIHDAYTRKTGCNCNERNFKSLGLTGFMISDKHEFLQSLFPDAPLAESPKEMAEIIVENINKDLTEIKAQNRQNVQDNHTYIKRIQQLLEL